MQNALLIKGGALSPFTELLPVPRCVAAEICDTMILTNAM